MPDAESFTQPDDSNVRKRDAKAKGIMKCYADKRPHAEVNPIDVGDVLYSGSALSSQASSQALHFLKQT